ncbi:AbrB/MazE/SpoVT family DNA-binding domain-containing protein [Ciceribacter sp. L1K23]|uniref:AbrB/MazE/SpoVT family DNA-binding domain-containing protein n=1 Tax=Ciceribacter sp. L1K23 TaxID=2820276 RepID=UPI001B838830|nr:AbrB/MazE/SpoVT family DNA-binding domain-containing protein [Ciceribacter sp. L1K23]MBR0558169.1 AbrB/MazE/SpoVT family DNA-binding domain-containing protein [Ciceribacter sp. L1K23]
MRVTSKGQVTIPRDLRELVGIEPNSEVVFTVEAGKLTIAPKSGKRMDSDRGRLADVLKALGALEGTGDQAIDADTLMTMTRDR